MAEATSGEESAGWESASLWLRALENDALAAAQHAAQAVELAKTGKKTEALTMINLSVSLESKYRTPQVWVALQQRIAEFSQSTDSASLR